MLLLDDGLSCEAVARVSTSTTTRCAAGTTGSARGRAQPVGLRLEGRREQAHPRQEAELTETLTRRLFASTAAVMAHIERAYGVAYSKPGVIKLLHRLGFEWRKH